MTVTVHLVECLVANIVSFVLPPLFVTQINVTQSADWSGRRVDCSIQAVQESLVVFQLFGQHENLLLVHRAVVSCETAGLGVEGDDLAVVHVDVGALHKPGLLEGILLEDPSSG